MREVVATEAGIHLARLPDSVARGGAIAMPRHGKPIAHLVPAGARELASRCREAHATLDAALVRAATAAGLLLVAAR